MTDLENVVILYFPKIVNVGGCLMDRRKSLSSILDDAADEPFPFVNRYDMSTAYRFTIYPLPHHE